MLYFLIIYQEVVFFLSVQLLTVRYELHDKGYGTVTDWGHFSCVAIL